MFAIAANVNCCNYLPTVFFLESDQTNFINEIFFQISRPLAKVFLSLKIKFLPFETMNTNKS